MTKVPLPTVLCVDDEIDNLDALERLLRRKFRVLRAASGSEALNVLKAHAATVATIISDQRMPQMTGVQFLAAAREMAPDAVRVLLTGYTDIESVVSAINTGEVYRYITKPWDPVDLVNTVDKAAERFALGQELKVKNQELAATNTRLAQALSELQSLDQAKTNFMMLINHELKTPLTTILSFTDLLAESAVDTSQLKYLQRIRSGAERLQKLVYDSLELISAETGKLPVRPMSMNTKALHPIIKDAELKSLAESRGLHIDAQIQESDLHTDERLLKQVMWRLLHNAIKFAVKDSTVEIRGSRSEQNSVYQFCLRNPISNKMNKEQIDKLMRPFELNENALHHSTGTGLGLTLSHAVLKCLGTDLDFRCVSDGKESSRAKNASGKMPGHPSYDYWVEVSWSIPTKK